jgi:hypothetical protein
MPEKGSSFKIKSIFCGRARVIARYKSQNLGSNWSQDMRIVPVNFNSEHKAMLGHCKMILEADGGEKLLSIQTDLTT